MIPREDIPELNMNISPDLKDDTLINVDDKNKVTYKEIKDNFSLKKSDPIRCLVYWDDICQFTSIALIDVLNSLLKTEVKIDIEHFLTRTNEYDYGMKYVYKIFEPVMSKEAINDVKRKFYWKIMELSPKSELFASLININSCFNSLGFYFPFRFDHCEELRAELDKIFFKDHGMANGVKFYYASDGVSFNDIMKTHSYNSIITPNIASTYAYIIQNKLKKITILGPDAHNGLTQDLYDLFYKYRKVPRPNYCSVSMFQERLFVN